MSAIGASHGPTNREEKLGFDPNKEEDARDL